MHNMWPCIILLEDGVWQTLKTGPLDATCQKCTNLRSNYHRSKLEMYLSYTKWLFKTLHQVQGLYVDIECKQETSVLLGDPESVLDHQNTASRIRTHWKRRHCATFCFNLCRSAHQSSRLSQRCIVQENQSDDRLADSPRCCKRRRTVRADTWHAAKMSISWLMICYLVVRFFNAGLTIWTHLPNLLISVWKKNPYQKLSFFRGQFKNSQFYFIKRNEIVFSGC